MNEPVRFNTAEQIAAAEFPVTNSLAERVRQYDFEDVEEPDAFAKIKAFCDSGTDADMLGIYRQLPAKKEQYLCKIMANEFDPDVIKDRFGGGDFIIKAYDDKNHIRLKQHLSIEGVPIIESAAPVLTPQASAAFDMQQFMQAMQESNRQMLAGIVQVMRPTEPSHSRMDMLNEMAAMKNLFGGDAPASGGIDMLMRGIELARDIAPREGGTTSGMDVLLESIKSFAPAIGAVVAQSKAAPQNRPANPQQPGQAQLAPPIPDVTQPENDTMLLKLYLGKLVTFAQEGREPALYAELIADNLSDDQILGIVNNPATLDDLNKLNPGVMQNKGWFEALILELKIIMGLTEPLLQTNVAGNPSILVPENDTKSAGDSAV